MLIVLPSSFEIIALNLKLSRHEIKSTVTLTKLNCNTKLSNRNKSLIVLLVGLSIHFDFIIQLFGLTLIEYSIIWQYVRGHNLG